MNKQRKLYAVQIASNGNVYSRTLGNRLVERNRAARICKWLKKRGADAYITPTMVNAALQTGKKAA